MKTRVKKRGNGHVIYIPKIIRKAMGWGKDTVIRIVLTKDGLVLETVNDDATKQP